MAVDGALNCCYLHHSFTVGGYMNSKYGITISSMPIWCTLLFILDLIEKFQQIDINIWKLDTILINSCAYKCVVCMCVCFGWSGLACVVQGKYCRLFIHVIFTLSLASIEWSYEHKHTKSNASIF